MKGLGSLSKSLEELGQFTSELDGELGTLNFNPFDAESIEQAIVSMESWIDERSGNYPNNSMIKDISVELKSTYRQAILDKASEVRLKGNNDE
ncbi:hypothetical protein OD757_06900 [Acinetobacter sp. AYS6]|uniref:hypothetical protein n=1 Tax=Acinetobacter sp. AYS6 TaxID=2983297 RepID=UPI0021D69C8B|nr:hypothetical protein [Acinetobacter sp. AYS6]MCU7696947.1 hypothetical protein [Acinetobacter sp. AYS6]